jgi:hypothetical protein
MSDVSLADASMAAFRLAADRSRDQELTTGQVFAALSKVDGLVGWSRLWLSTGAPEILDLEAASDARGARISWQGLVITEDLSRALQLLAQACVAFDLAPATPGLVALALVADPHTGAARALTQRGLSHDDLLEIIQTDLIGTKLEGFELLAAKTLAEDRSIDNPVWEAYARANDRIPDDLDLVWALTRNARTQETMESLGIDSGIVEEFETPLRKVGVLALSSLVSVEDQGGVVSPSDLIKKVAESPSPGVALLFKLAGVDAPEVRVAANVLKDAEVSRRRTVGRFPTWAIINLVGSLTVAAMVVIHVVGPGRWWELLLIPFISEGFPRWPPIGSLFVAIPLLLISPWIAAVQVIVAGADWALARSVRRQIAVLSGEHLTSAATRRVVLRRTKRGRRHLQRFRWLRVIQVSRSLPAAGS